MCLICAEATAAAVASIPLWVRGWRWLCQRFRSPQPRTCPNCGSTELSRFNKDICLDCHHMKVA